VSVARINTALNGSRPRRLKPSAKTLADLGRLLQEAETVLNSTAWLNDTYRERELACLDRRFGEFNVAHPDLEQWQSLGELPALLADAFNAKLETALRS
jgi:hypothetical protein